MIRMFFHDNFQKTEVGESNPLRGLWHRSDGCTNRNVEKPKESRYFPEFENSVFFPQKTIDFTIISPDTAETYRNRAVLSMDEMLAKLYYFPRMREFGAKYENDRNWK